MLFAASGLFKKIYSIEPHDGIEEFNEITNTTWSKVKDEYKLNDEQINIILSSFDIMQFLEKVISTTKIEPKKIVNYFISSLYIKINKENYDLNDKNIEPQEFCHIIEALESNKISKNNLKKIIDELFLKKDSVDKIIDNLSVKNGNDDKFIDDLIEEIIINNKKQVDDYKNGKTKILGFFVGQVLKKAKNYDPSLIKEKIIKALEDIWKNWNSIES